MKRIAVTGFALLYALLVYGRYADRTAIWIEDLTGNSSKQHNSIAVHDGEESRKFSNGQKRTLPDQSALVPPLVALGMVLESDQFLAPSAETHTPGRLHQSISSRAPPAVS